MNQNISFVYGMKRDKISFKPKVKGRKTCTTYRGLSQKLWAKFDQLSYIFHGINQSWQTWDCIWWNFQVILTIFSINLLDFYQNNWNITKFNDILYFITFSNFVQWWRRKAKFLTSQLPADGYSATQTRIIGHIGLKVKNIVVLSKNVQAA